MTYRQVFLAAAVLAASAIPAAAQGPGLFGFYDPATGAFTPVQPPVTLPAAGTGGFDRLAIRHIRIQDHAEDRLQPSLWHEAVLFSQRQP